MYDIVCILEASIWGSIHGEIIIVKVIISICIFLVFSVLAMLYSKSFGFCSYQV